MKILSICTSAGLWDKVMIERGHTVVAGCELMRHKRAMYNAYCHNGKYILGAHMTDDLSKLPALVAGKHFDAVIGGPPCQSLSTLKAMVNPKFPDLTPAVAALMEVVRETNPQALFLFENVRPLPLNGLVSTKSNAMHYPEELRSNLVHQSRVRYFTHSENVHGPAKAVEGTVDSLMAYPVVAGRIYGPKRGAILQGHPEFAKLDFPCKYLQEALADGVPRGLATAWAEQLEQAHARAKCHKYTEQDGCMQFICTCVPSTSGGVL